MKSIAHTSRRTRLRLTLLLVLSLLVQQLALAAYVCATPTMPTGDVAMVAHCQDMSMGQAKQALALSLCPWHCAQQSMSAQGTQSPSVPILPFAAPLPLPPVLIVLPTTQAMHVHAALWRAPGIPPEFRFRVLLI